MLKEIALFLVTICFFTDDDDDNEDSLSLITKIKHAATIIANLLKKNERKNKLFPKLEQFN